MNLLVDWSKKKENQGKKIYKHKLRCIEENISENRFYNPSKDNARFGSDLNIDIPYCDLVYYLDIYWQ